MTVSWLACSGRDDVYLFEFSPSERKATYRGSFTTNKGIWVGIKDLNIRRYFSYTHIPTLYARNED